MCTILVVAAWAIGMIHAVSQFVFVINLPFWGPNNVGTFTVTFLGLLSLHAWKLTNWNLCHCQQWLHIYGHLLYPDSVIHLYSAHCVTTFFMWFTQCILDLVSSHHCGGYVFHSMHVSLCVSFPHGVTGWKFCYCGLCCHSRLKPCDLYLKEYRYETGDKKAESTGGKF